MYVLVCICCSVWKNITETETKTSLSTWPRFKVAFLSRFQEAKSAGEQVSIISNLKQQQKERVRDYFDRVNNSVHLSAHDSLLAMRADATVTTADQGFSGVHHSFYEGALRFWPQA